MIGPGEPRELSRLQQWLQQVIMHPHGVVEGIASAEARRQIDVLPGEVEQVIARSQALTSVERLQIYSNAYSARLLECLREEFPSLVHALGEETFDAFAFGYLQAHPSRSYTLADLGRDFPRYLAETRPRDDESTGANGAPDWPDFLIDLATLERTYSEVFDGPGVEGQRLLQTADLMSIPAEMWPEARLVPVACLRLLTLSYPAHEYASAVRHGEKAVPPNPAPTYLVVTRREYVVRRAAVSRAEYELLAALLAGQTIGSAIEHATRYYEADLEFCAVELRQWFQDWAASGYFSGVQTP